MVYTEITDLNDETFALQLERKSVGEKPADFEFSMIVPKPRPYVPKPAQVSTDTQYFYSDHGGVPPVVVGTENANDKKGKGKKGKKK